MRRVLELSVVLPTWNRRGLLAEGLRRLESQHADSDFEVIVVDNISEDGTQEMVRDFARAARVPVRLVEQRERLPLAGSRNLGVDAAEAEVLLFMNDDGWARPGLVARHLAFHRERPGRADALVGGVRGSPEIERTPFMTWLDDVLRFRSPPGDWDDVAGIHFHTMNASAKARLVRDAGGFDARFQVGYEDAELGLRLATAGMRLRHDPAALVEHFHPAGLELMMRQLRRYGAEYAKLRELHPEHEFPRRPSARHRVKASALHALYASGIRPRPVKREVWRFLTHQTHREALWEGIGSGCEPRIGARLARRALRDPDAAMPGHRIPPWEPACGR